MEHLFLNDVRRRICDTGYIGLQRKSCAIAHILPGEVAIKIAISHKIEYRVTLYGISSIIGYGHSLVRPYIDGIPHVSIAAELYAERSKVSVVQRLKYFLACTSPALYIYARSWLLL